MDSSPVWQINIHHCKLASDNLVSEVMKMKRKPILLIQEPYLFREKPLLRINNYAVHYVGKNVRSLIAIPCNLRSFSVHELSDKDTTAVLLEENVHTTDETNNETTIKYLLVSSYLDILDKKVINQGLEKCATFSKTNRIPMVIGMDSNSHSTLWGCETNNSRGDVLEEFILEQNLAVMNVGHAPTFVTKRAKSIIDVTLVSDTITDKVANWNVNKEYQFSDHRRLEFEIKYKAIITVVTRNFRKANWNIFKSFLGKNRNWNPPCFWNKLVLDEEVDKYTHEIQKSLDVACPKRKININKAKKVWWSNNLENLKRNSKRRYKKYAKDKSETSYDSFHKSRKEYYDAIKAAKSQAWHDFCSSIQDVKSLSKVSRSLINESNSGVGLIKKADGTLASSGKEVINALMDTHFPGSYPYKDLGKLKEDTTLSNAFISNANFLSYITKEKVAAAIKSFSGFKAAGPDGLKAVVLQNLPDFYLERLTILYKVCTALKWNPKEWCRSRVIFIPKRGKESYDTPKSYRPISLTQVLFKTLEKVQKMEIEDNYLKRKPMYKHQYAFSKGKSTEGALSQVVDKIESGLYRNGFTLGVFLDISGAFDNVLVDSIIAGFKSKGISEHITNWYESSLRNRLAEANIGDTVVKRALTKGCAQGGVLSTVAWNLAVDDLLQDLNKAPFLVVGFADDFAALISGIDPNTLVAKMQPVIDKITATGKKLGLSFNEEKTDVVMFTNKRTKITDKVKVNKVPREYSSSTRYLGTILDAKLNFNKHIDEKIKKCKNHLFALKNLIGFKWGPTPTMMKWAFTGIVRPKLTYACHIWQPRINKTLRIKLQKLNRLACLNIARAHRSTPTKGLELIYNLPPLENHIQRASLNCYLRIKYQVQKSWDGIGSHKNGHLMLLEKNCDSAGLANIPLDSIVPIRVWDKNYKIIEFNKNCDFSENGTSIYCYTDGSKIEKSRTGCGFTIKRDGKTMASGFESLGTIPTVFQTEIQAIVRGCEAMEKRTGQKIVIRSDSQAAILALGSNLIKSKLVLECFTKLNNLGKSNKITIQWIKAHVGFQGNEEADMLAKKGAEQALNGPEPFLPAPESFLKKTTKNILISNWNFNWRNTKDCKQTKLWLPKVTNKVEKYLNKITRQDLSKLVQFITGHCNLMRHKSLQSNQEPLCRLCEKGEETPWHLATKCTSLMNHRMNIFCGQILYSVDWSPGQLLRFCKESKIWSLLDYQL